ncbi:MAG: hypothetical protein AT711_03000 [Thermoproteus sp. CIS_19]|nr:MAG: hypothetical protein AT711_03000 [Thermoproteus sp. CIS_19]
MPAPACILATSPLIARVLIIIANSPPLGVKRPKPPAYGPLGMSSSSPMISMALTLGAPETVPAG